MAKSKPKEGPVTAFIFDRTVEELLEFVVSELTACDFLKGGHGKAVEYAHGYLTDLAGNGTLDAREVFDLLKPNPNVKDDRERLRLLKVWLLSQSTDNGSERFGKWSDLEALYDELKATDPNTTDRKIVGAFRKRFSDQWSTQRREYNTIDEAERSLIKALQNYRQRMRRGAKSSTKFATGKTTPPAKSRL